MTLALRRHADAEAFLAEALEALEVDETANNLILGVPLSLRMHPARAMVDAYYASVHTQGAFVGAALRTPPYHLIVHVEQSAAADGEAIVALLLDDALAHAGDLNGVNGRVPGRSVLPSRGRFVPAGAHGWERVCARLSCARSSRRRPPRVICARRVWQTRPRRLPFRKPSGTR